MWNDERQVKQRASESTVPTVISKSTQYIRTYIYHGLPSSPESSIESSNSIEETSGLAYAVDAKVPSNFN